MNPNVNIIANRLSLRPPQRESLEILAKVCDVPSPWRRMQTCLPKQHRRAWPSRSRSSRPSSRR